MTRKRGSPWGLELAVSVTLVIALLPLLALAAPLQDATEIQQYTEGCYYNYNHYNEGDRILTNEPCLNCTCHNKMLMCYLRVCPFTKPIGHDCIVEKREDQCCPIITCPEVPVDVANHAPEPGTELSIPEKFGCSIDDQFYPEGAQVPSNPNKPCELCYCIRNHTSCLMQECTLHIDGCTPIYNKGSCCPVRYNCDHENDVLELEDRSTTTTVRPTEGFVITTTMSPAKSTDCSHNGEVYADGTSIIGKNACEHCYCMRGDIVCAVQECEMPMLSSSGKSCHAVPLVEGECCPNTYICEDDSATTQLVKATTPDYIEEENKITTISAVKDIHGSISEEDIQLQKHIDEDQEKEVPTESPLHSAEIISIGSINEGSGDDSTEPSIGIEHETATTQAISLFTEATPVETETDKMHRSPISERIDTTTTKEIISDKVPIKTDESSLHISTVDITTAKTDITELTVRFEGGKSDITNAEPILDTNESVTNEPISSGNVHADEIFTTLPTLDVLRVKTPEPSIFDVDKEQVDITSAISSLKDIKDEINIVPTENPSTIKESEDNVETLTTMVPAIDSEGDERTDIPVERSDIPVTEKEVNAIGDTTTPANNKDGDYDFVTDKISHLESVPETTTRLSVFITSDGEEELIGGVHIKDGNKDQASVIEHYTSEESTESVLTQKPIDKLELTTIDSANNDDKYKKGFTTIASIIIDDAHTTETLDKITESVIDAADGTTSTGDNMSSEITVLSTTETAIPSITKEHEGDSTISSIEKTPSTEEVLPSIFESYNLPSTSAPRQDENIIEEMVAGDSQTTSKTTLDTRDDFGNTDKTLSAASIDVDSTTIRLETFEEALSQKIPDMQFPAFIPGEGDCLVGKKTYENNSVIPTADECETSCKCVSSIVVCGRVKCDGPKNIDKCVLDEVSTDKCCPTYNCGIERLPSKSVSTESVQGQNELTSDTTSSYTPSTTDGVEANESKKESIPPKTGPKEHEDTTIIPPTDIVIIAVSTEEPMSHVKDVVSENHTETTPTPPQVVSGTMQPHTLESTTHTINEYEINEVSTIIETLIENIITPKPSEPLTAGAKEYEHETTPHNLEDNTSVTTSPIEVNKKDVSENVTPAIIGTTTENVPIILGEKVAPTKDKNQNSPVDTHKVIPIAMDEENEREPIDDIFDGTESSTEESGTKVLEESTTHIINSSPEKGEDSQIDDITASTVPSIDAGEKKAIEETTAQIFTASDDKDEKKQKKAPSDTISLQEIENIPVEISPSTESSTEDLALVSPNHTTLPSVMEEENEITDETLKPTSVSLVDKVYEPQVNETLGIAPTSDEGIKKFTEESSAHLITPSVDEDEKETTNVIEKAEEPTTDTYLSTTVPTFEKTKTKPSVEFTTHTSVGNEYSIKVEKEEEAEDIIPATTVSGDEAVGNTSLPSIEKERQPVPTSEPTALLSEQDKKKPNQESSSNTDAPSVIDIELIDHISNPSIGEAEKPTEATLASTVYSPKEDTNKSSEEYSDHTAPPSISEDAKEFGKDILDQTSVSSIEKIKKSTDESDLETTTAFSEVVKKEPEADFTTQTATLMEQNITTDHTSIPSIENLEFVTTTTTTYDKFEMTPAKDSFPHTVAPLSSNDVIIDHTLAPSIKEEDKLAHDNITDSTIPSIEEMKKKPFDEFSANTNAPSIYVAEKETADEYLASTTSSSMVASEHPFIDKITATTTPKAEGTDNQVTEQSSKHTDFPLSGDEGIMDHTSLSEESDNKPIEESFADTVTHSNDVDGNNIMNDISVSTTSSPIEEDEKHTLAEISVTAVPTSAEILNKPFLEFQPDISSSAENDTVDDTSAPSIINEEIPSYVQTIGSKIPAIETNIGHTVSPSVSESVRTSTEELLSNTTISSIQQGEKLAEADVSDTTVALCQESDCKYAEESFDHTVTHSGSEDQIADYTTVSSIIKEETPSEDEIFITQVPITSETGKQKPSEEDTDHTFSPSIDDKDHASIASIEKEETSLIAGTLVTTVTSLEHIEKTLTEKPSIQTETDNTAEIVIHTTISSMENEVKTISPEVSLTTISSSEKIENKGTIEPFIEAATQAVVDDEKERTDKLIDHTSVPSNQVDGEPVSDEIAASSIPSSEETTHTTLGHTLFPIHDKDEGPAINEVTPLIIPSSEEGIENATEDSVTSTVGEYDKKLMDKIEKYEEIASSTTLLPISDEYKKQDNKDRFTPSVDDNEIAKDHTSLPSMKQEQKPADDAMASTIVPSPEENTKKAFEEPSPHTFVPSDDNEIGDLTTVPSKQKGGNPAVFDSSTTTAPSSEESQHKLPEESADHTFVPSIGDSKIVEDTTVPSNEKGEKLAESEISDANFSSSEENTHKPTEESFANTVAPSVGDHEVVGHTSVPSIQKEEKPSESAMSTTNVPLSEDDENIPIEESSDNTVAPSVDENEIREHTSLSSGISGSTPPSPDNTVAPLVIDDEIVPLTENVDNIGKTPVISGSSSEEGKTKPTPQSTGDSLDHTTLTSLENYGISVTTALPSEQIDYEPTDVYSPEHISGADYEILEHTSVPSTERSRKPTIPSVMDIENKFTVESFAQTIAPSVEDGQQESTDELIPTVVPSIDKPEKETVDNGSVSDIRSNVQLDKKPLEETTVETLPHISENINGETYTTATELPKHSVKTDTPSSVEELMKHTTHSPTNKDDFVEQTSQYISILSGIDEHTTPYLLVDSEIKTTVPIELSTSTHSPLFVASLDSVEESEDSIESEEEIMPEHKIQHMGEFVTERSEKNTTQTSHKPDHDAEHETEIPLKEEVKDVDETIDQSIISTTVKDEYNDKTLQPILIVSAAISTTINPEYESSTEVSKEQLPDYHPHEIKEEDITNVNGNEITTQKILNLNETENSSDVENITEKSESSDEINEDDGEHKDNELVKTTIHSLFSQHTTTISPLVTSIESFDDRISSIDSTTPQKPSQSPLPNDDELFQSSTTSTSTNKTTSTTDTSITTTIAPISQYPPTPPIYGQPPQYPSYPEDEYTDEDETEVFGPGTCRYGGKLYVSAQQIPRDDPCDFCFCFRSDIICLQQSCPPPIAGCHEEPISGFCCPRYECPVSMATVLNITTSTTTTSTTLPPHFLHHNYGSAVQRNGCQISGKSYRVGEKIESTSGPCINCTCGGDGKMKCDPQACVPEPTMQQVMAVVAAGRKR